MTLTQSTGIDLTPLAGSYTIDPAHSSLAFVVRHAMVTKVRGTFDSFQGTATLDAENPAASTVNVTIDVASIDTRSADRDAHLRSADFFEVDRYPTMTFVSTAIELVDAETVSITGDLTIRDITRPVTIPFTFNGSQTDPWGQLRIGFEGAVEVLRKDWGLTWNTALETGGVLVSEKARLEFDISAVRQA